LHKHKIVSPTAGRKSGKTVSTYLKALLNIGNSLCLSQ
jgi:hypothetical protein